MPLIKTMVVMAELEAGEVGTLELSAPLGVGLDMETAKPSIPLLVDILGDPVLTPTIIRDTLIYEGFFVTKVELQNEKSESNNHSHPNYATRVYIPIFSVVNAIGVKPDDHVSEVLRIDHISVMGVPEALASGLSGVKVKLFVHVLFTITITVTREELTCLPDKPDRFDHAQRAVESVVEQPVEVRARHATSSPTKDAKKKTNKTGAWSHFWHQVGR